MPVRGTSRSAHEARKVGTLAAVEIRMCSLGARTKLESLLASFCRCCHSIGSYSACVCVANSSGRMQTRQTSLLIAAHDSVRYLALSSGVMGGQRTRFRRIFCVVVWCKHIFELGDEELENETSDEIFYFLFPFYS